MLLGGTKEWAGRRKTAFATLLGRPINKVLDKADHDIPSPWPAVVDRRRDRSRCEARLPRWVGLPSGGIHAMGDLQHDARGIFVIENADTFPAGVCAARVADRWLCIWGEEGSATSGVVASWRS